MMISFITNARLASYTRRSSSCSQRDHRSVPVWSVPRCSYSPPASSKNMVFVAQARKPTEAGPAIVSERRSAGYHPSIWVDHFHKYSSTESMIISGGAVERVQELKLEVKRMLAVIDYGELSEKLDLIDQIQRLGIAYQFEGEIKATLGQIHAMFVEDQRDLHTTALRFRLLRQQGYLISPDVFYKFKDSEGNFRPSLIDDVRGLLSLYEASHCKVHGEEILEEALSFCVTHLKPMEEESLPVRQALKQCMHRGVPRLEARRYIDNYHIEHSDDEVLLNLAKVDFNWSQEQHQREVAEIASWWKDLDFGRKLPFARDRVVECYFWILGVYFESKYSTARKFTTKVIALISIVDDTYDVYGTPEELEIFTEAIERWDIGALNELPGYMQVSYSAILDVYREIEEILAGQGRIYYLYYAKEAFKIMVRAYNEEAKRFLQQQHVPTVEEYMDVARITAGYRTLTITSLIGMPEITTRDTFEWLLSDPKIVKAAGTACRIMDDIASHKFEQEREHIASVVECYIKQFGITEHEAEEKLKELVDDAWKDINEEFLRLDAVPTHVLERIVNFTRMLDVVYKDGDCYTNSETKLKDIIASLLIHPVPM